MRRMTVFGLLGICLAALVHANDPKPPWQRLLKGDDAKKAAELAKRIEELEAADRYSEAISLAEELPDLRTKVQGGDTGRR